MQINITTNKQVPNCYWKKQEKITLQQSEQSLVTILIQEEQENYMLVINLDQRFLVQRKLGKKA
jgi:hypothetical protein